MIFRKFSIWPTTKSLVTVCLILSLRSALGQDYYWVGNSGNWSDLAHWATSSGGSTFHLAAPTAANNVYFDANSFSSVSQIVTIDVPAYCKSLDWTGVANSPTLSITSDLSIDESLTLVAGMALSGLGSFRFTSAGTGNTITTAGRQLRNIAFDGLGDWTLQDALTSTGELYLTMGTLNTNSHPVSLNYFFSAGSDLTRQLNLGSSAITCYDWNLTDNTNFSLNAGTSTITITLFFGGGGNAYHDVTLDGPNIYVYNSNSFNNLTINAGSSVFIEEGNVQTLTGLQATGDCADLIYIQSTTPGTTTAITKSSGTVNLSNVKLTDMAATGGATFNVTNYIDGGNNTGWTTVALSGATYYWVGNGGNWSDPNHWSLSSGGPASGCLPSQLDNVLFDLNSFSSSGQAVIVDDLNANCLSMDWSGVTNSPNLGGTRDLNIYGSLTLAAGMTVTYGGFVDMAFRSNSTGNTIFTAGHVLNCSVRLDGSGEWTLQGDIILNTGNQRRLYLDKGSLTTNGHDITAYSFNTTTELTRQLMLGSSTITCSNQWNLFNKTNLTFDAGTSTIIIGSSGTFYGAGLSYHNVQMNSDQQIIVEGSNSFNELTVANSGIILFTGGTTQTLNTLTIPSGTGCTDFVTIGTSDPGFPATLSTSGSFSGTFLLINDIVATGSGTFTATNSIGTGNVSGWNITSIVGKNFYWIGGGGSWHDTNHWSLSSGGPSGNCLPTLVDDVIFDGNSFNATAQSVLINTSATCNSMNWTGATFSPRLTGSAKLTARGSLTLIQNMTVLYTGQIYFLGEDAGNTITTAGGSLKSNLYFDGSGEYVLQDNLKTSGAINHRKGTLKLNGFDLTAGEEFSSYHPLPRNLQLGSGKVTASAWQILDPSNLTFDAGTSEIICTTGGSQFDGAGLTYFDVTLRGINAVSMTGSNTFHYLTLEPGVYLNLLASTTQTVSRLYAVGTVDKPISLLTSSTGVVATISQSTPDFCGDYLVIQDIAATGGINFHAGSNSTDSGNNTGWSFTSCLTPVADAGADDSICLLESLSIGGTPTASGTPGPFTYSWSPTTGLNDPTIANPTATPETTTTYTVTVIDNLSAQSTDMITITVNPLPTANAGVDVAVCVGGSIELNATGGDSYSWLPAAPLSNSAIANPVATVSITTVFEVTATGTNGCSAKDYVKVTADMPVTANAGLDVAICKGSEVTLNGSGGVLYSWSPVTGLSNPAIAGPLATPVTTTLYELTVTTGECSDTDEVVVTVNPNPVADAGPDAAICALESIFIGGISTGSGGTGPYQFEWSPVSFLNSSTLANPVASPTATTSFVVTVVDANGCSGTDGMTLTVHPRPVANAGVDVSSCPSAPITVGGQPAGSGGTPPYMFSWSPSNLVNNSLLANPIAASMATTDLTLDVTDANGCTGFDVMTLTIDNLVPQAAFTYNETGPGAYAFTDTSTDPVSWRWDFGDGKSATTRNPTHAYAANGMYEVCLTVTSACSEDTSCQTINAVVTGINDMIVGGVTIYPNPAHHEFYLSLESPRDGNMEIVVVDAKGQPVFNHSSGIWYGPASFSIRTADWPPGIYLINIRVDDVEVRKRILVHGAK